MMGTEKQTERLYIVNPAIHRYVAENFDELDKRYKKIIVESGKEYNHDDFVELCLKIYDQEKRYD